MRQASLAHAIQRKHPDSRAIQASRLAISGQRRGIRAVLPFIGPSLIAAIAYVDPGNFATNIQGGAAYGYRLLWVVLLANLMAMVIQNLAAKLGIATGKNLPEMCRAHLPRGLNFVLWGVAELAAMATDVAEFLGASLALHLLFGIALWQATLAAGVVTYVILTLQRLGFRPLELFIGGFLAVIALCYVVETGISSPPWGEVVRHLVTPWLGDGHSVLLAAGIVGATVMPHAIYLHSGLTERRIIPRNEAEAVRVYRFQRLDVVLAMAVAGGVNLSMMYMAARVFHDTGHAGVADIASAYRMLTPLLGPFAAAVFLVSLLASGLSSSAVGTLAGQVVMQGFVGFRIPVWVRRLVTMLPSIAVVASGADPMQVLVLSQVVLSLALPAPLLTLLYFTNRRRFMGALVNPWWLKWLARLITAAILVLNAVLLWLAG
ncbi:divalent metal cation transporter MntH [Alicyclobacillus cellulosilyticus]|uniref:Divalent metal cation transporter MntH n=1 Tax=Alicyclobacillus cellulosilyticus TaxID=1003997 RepID=A0A917KDB7_9BACL|nr:Nramp family divalent metal transporter [Alicyclobacillus cellulosilyticus]GGJ07779.1 divalent metal cation transporter MntH [Alicyclobacillus cellulosilyticus]